MLKEGSPAPNFSLNDQDGNIHSLNDYNGKWVLLFFYPKDDTLFCIKEACSIRDDYPEYEKNNVKVFGINQDSEESHKAFVNKHKLPFTLLSDPSKEVISAYKASGILMTKRISYLINPEGNIQKTFPFVNSFTHGKDVLKSMV